MRRLYANSTSCVYIYIHTYICIYIGFPGGPGTSSPDTAAAAKSLQLCPTLRNPTTAHQAPPSLGFSRQEH